MAIQYRNARIAPSSIHEDPIGLDMEHYGTLAHYSEIIEGEK
jgi:hypothetical protein